MAALPSVGSPQRRRGAGRWEFVAEQGSSDHCGAPETCVEFEAPGDVAGGMSRKRMRRCLDAALPTGLTGSRLEDERDAGGTCGSCGAGVCSDVLSVVGVGADGIRGGRGQLTEQDHATGTAGEGGSGGHRNCSARPRLEGVGAGVGGMDMARVKGLESDNRRLKNNVLLLQLQVQLLRQIVSLSQHADRVTAHVHAISGSLPPCPVACTWRRREREREGERE